MRQGTIPPEVVVKLYNGAARQLNRTVKEAYNRLPAEKRVDFLKALGWSRDRLIGHEILERDDADLA